MQRTPAHELADHKLGEEGALEALVRSARDEGRSWEAIARNLHADHAITITGEALRKWFAASATASG